MTATCKSCQADIIWVKTASGRSMPLDAKPEQRVVIENGVGFVRATYTSHFATCPQAAQHRRSTTPAGPDPAKEPQKP